jgi:hypothetical protein
MTTKGFIGGITNATTLLALGALVVAVRFVGLPALLVTVLAFAAIGALLDERATAHEVAICASFRPIVTTEPSTLRRGSAGANVPRGDQWHC